MSTTPAFSAVTEGGPSREHVVGFSLYDVVGHVLHTIRYDALERDADGWFVISVGRDADCVVGNRPGSTVSRHHADIEAIVDDAEGPAGRVMLTDQSTNGTSVRHMDGTVERLHAMDSLDLVDGDEICLPSDRKADAMLRFNYLYGYDA